MDARRLQRRAARRERFHQSDTRGIVFERFDANDMRLAVAIDERDIGVVWRCAKARDGNALEAAREWRRGESHRGTNGRVGEFVKPDRIEAHRIAGEETVEFAKGDVGEIADRERSIVQAFARDRLAHRRPHGAFHELRRLPDKREPLVHHLHGVMVRRP